MIAANGVTAKYLENRGVPSLRRILRTPERWDRIVALAATLGERLPPQADSGWIGEAGPGPSYLDEGSGGPDNDFTNRNTTFMTWNLLHAARMLKDAGGVPAHGNQRSLWDAGCRFDFANPDYR